MARVEPGGGEEGEGTWINFCWVCAAGLSEPLPGIIVYSVPIIDPILVTLGKCNFHDPNLVTFYLCIYLINPLNRSYYTFTFHLQYKHSGAFANCKYEELSCN